MTSPGRLSRRAPAIATVLVVVGHACHSAPTAPGTGGTDGTPLDAAFTAARQEPNLRSLVVARDGAVVREAFFNGGGPDSDEYVWSVTKSMLALTVGIALDRGPHDGAFRDGHDGPVAAHLRHPDAADRSGVLSMSRPDGARMGRYVSLRDRTNPATMRHARLAMKRLACVCAVFGAVVLTPVSFSAQGTTRVLVVTGGHAFEAEPFFSLFRDNPAIAFAAAEHGKDNATAWERDDLATFDVIVLYDMPRNITPAQQGKMRSLFERGAGLVVLHHALVSFQDWPDYERIIGGRYPEPPQGQPAVSDKLGYEHDVEVPVTILDAAHPITAGMKDFTIRDEIYWGFRVGGDVHPLLGTTHPKAGKPLMWTRAEGKSRVVFLQLGHDRHAFENPNFRELVARSIRWAARR